MLVSGVDVLDVLLIKSIVDRQHLSLLPYLSDGGFTVGLVTLYSM